MRTTIGAIRIFRFCNLRIGLNENRVYQRELLMLNNIPMGYKDVYINWKIPGCVCGPIARTLASPASPEASFFWGGGASFSSQKQGAPGRSAPGSSPAALLALKSRGAHRWAPGVSPGGGTGGGLV